jgi:hypothetical protein
MLADADEINPDLIGENGLFDQVADDLRRMQRRAVRAFGDVAEGIETEFDAVNHAPLYQVRRSAGARVAAQIASASAYRQSGRRSADRSAAGSACGTQTGAISRHRETFTHR